MRPNSFNPKARWDRFNPDAESGNPDEPKERIAVLAYFEHTKIFPRKFIWNNKEYLIENITYNWQARCGQATINYFSVLSAGQLYQISFNNTSYRWQLDKVIN